MLSQHKGIVLLQSGESHRISAHKAARTHHSPAYNQPLHYVVLTVQTAEFQRKDRLTGTPKMATHPRQNEYSKPEREGGQKSEVREESKVPALSLLGSLPSAWKRSVPGDLLLSWSYFKANKINEPQIPVP